MDSHLVARAFGALAHESRLAIFRALVVAGPNGMAAGEIAQQLGVATLADLARVAPQLTFGTDLEFQSRPEWRQVRDAYGLSFATVKSYNPTFMYRALEDGQADVITAFSSDGRILAQDLVTLGDPKNALPHYDAIVLISPKRAGDAKLLAALEPLVGAIDLERMRRARVQIATVVQDDALVGVVTLDDLLSKVLPVPEDAGTGTSA